MASHEVLLGSPELLENILSFLWHVELIDAYHVCKQFKAVIARSLTFQRELFLRAENWDGNKAVRINEMLLTRMDPPGSAKITHYGILHHNNQTLQETYPAGASAWNMFLTQPPTTAAKVNWKMEWYDENGKLTSYWRQQCEVYSTEGTRLRDLLYHDPGQARFSRNRVTRKVIMESADILLVDVTSPKHLKDLEKRKENYGVILKKSVVSKAVKK